MRIGFDFDGVFIDKPPFIPKKLIERLYKKKSSNLSYRFPSKAEQVIRILSHKKIFRPPIRENIATIKKYKKNGSHTFFLISGRFGFIKKETENLLKHYQLEEMFKKRFINYDNNQPHIHKKNVLKHIQLDRYVDDDFDLILFLSKITPKTIFFWVNKLEDKKISKNLFAITDFSKVFKDKL